jgi:Mn-dependent DtxR family transcriptional regulator
MTTPAPSLIPEEMKQKIVEYLQRVRQGASRDIAKSIKADKHMVDKAITELINAGTLVYVNYGGMTYVALAGKFADEGTPSTP